MDIDLNGLLVFRHVAESGSFTDTAKYWRISQPTVSQMILRLESAVGLILLERSPSGTRLTPAGNHFLLWATDVCDAYLTFIDGMRTLGRRMDHRVLVGFDRSWFANVLREALAKTDRTDGPELSFSEIGEIWWENLETSQYDIVVAGRFLQAGLSRGIQEGVIRRERGITVAWNPDFYPFDAINFSFPEALRTTVLIPDPGVITGFSAFLLLWCDCAYGVRPANVVSFPSESEAAAAAMAGLGVFLGPGDAIPRLGPEADGLTSVRTFEFLLPDAFTFGVYCRSGEDSKEVLSTAAFISKLGSKLMM